MDSLDAILPTWMQAATAVGLVIGGIGTALGFSLRKSPGAAPEVVATRADFMEAVIRESRENREYLARIAVSNEAMERLMVAVSNDRRMLDLIDKANRAAAEGQAHTRAFQDRQDRQDKDSLDRA